MSTAAPADMRRRNSATVVASVIFLRVRNRRNGYWTIVPQPAQAASMWVKPWASRSATVRSFGVVLFLSAGAALRKAIRGSRSRTKSNEIFMSF